MRPHAPLALLVAAAVALGSVAGCAGGGDPDPAALAAATTEVDFDVQGMTCASCEIAIKTALRKVPGVAEVRADSDAGTAWARFDPARTDGDALAAAIDHLGYAAKVRGAATTEN